MKIIKLQIASYKKAQVFKRDYVRKNEQFIKLSKCSGNHSYAEVELKPGEEFDARGSVYRVGVTKWNAVDCQSWAKFRYEGEHVVALNFDGKEIPFPNWCSVIGGDEALEGDECKSVSA